MEAVTCNPRYGCLTCRLPARYCESTDPKVRAEEKQMLRNAGITKIGRPCANRNDLDKTHSQKDFIV